MTPYEVIERLVTIIADEREAIQAIDATRVESLAMEKVMLLRAMTPEMLHADETLHHRFRSVADDLRNNAVILAHARNCLRDVVQIATPSAPTTYGAQGRIRAPGGSRVSLTG